MSTPKEKRQIKHKLSIINCSKFGTNVRKKCRYYGIARSQYYVWKKRLAADGEKGLINGKPCPSNWKIRTSKETEERVVHIRKNYHLGSLRISWYMQRYYQTKISSHGVQCVLKRHGLSRLPNMKQNSPGPHFTRYEKKVPGHHIQVDVKVLIFKVKEEKVKRYQYTAIDDATRIRVLKIFPKHTQESSIAFAKHFQKEFPFRIKMVRTDNGHEFQSQFHWYLMDEGIEHAYIRKGTPRLNGKVERSHRIDKHEFYQAVDYKGDQDLSKKLADWQNFYNFNRPHGAHAGKTPYEVLHEKLKA